MAPLAISCAAIGSVNGGNFGWARLAVGDDALDCSTGQDIALFAELVARDLNNDWQVALGFECPLFVPVPADPAELTSARPGEGDRPGAPARGPARWPSG